jgi:hypothetical protein
MVATGSSRIRALFATPPESATCSTELQLEIVLGIVAYTAVAALIVRFFQGLRSRDDDMRAITERWIQEEKNPPLPN